jgi:hypothetical protein
MITLANITVTASQLSGDISVGRRNTRVSFRLCEGSAPVSFAASAEAFLMVALPVALATGHAIHFEGVLDERLLGALPAIGARFREWDPALHPVRVSAAESRANRPAKEQAPATDHRREAAFFTAGVDSFYTAQQRPNADLLYVYGLDVKSRKTPLARQIGSSLSHCAAAMGRPLVLLETNLREVTDRYLSWHYSWGFGLAACAQVLYQSYKDFAVSTSYSDRDEALHGRILPDGGHPSVIRLLQSSKVNFRSIGGEAKRIEKIAAIADLPVAQENLRVCWENRGSQYNCGACEKCVRTMVALDALNRLDAFPVFKRPLDYQKLAATVPGHPAVVSFITENLEAARSNGAAPALINALEASLGAHPWLRRIRAKHTPRRVHDWLYRLGF